jgi:hypothetical protein
LGSAPDAELLEFAGGCLGVQIDIFDEPAHSLPDGLDQLVGLLVRAFNDEFHPAIGQVAHIAADVVLQGNVPTGVAKTDTLDAPSEQGNRPLDGLDARNWHGELIYSDAAIGAATKFLPIFRCKAPTAGVAASLRHTRADHSTTTNGGRRPPDGTAPINAGAAAASS